MAAFKRRLPSPSISHFESHEQLIYPIADQNKLRPIFQCWASKYLLSGSLNL